MNKPILSANKLLVKFRLIGGERDTQDGTAPVGGGNLTHTIISLPTTVDMSGQENVLDAMLEVAAAAEEKQGPVLTTPIGLAEYMRQSTSEDDWDSRIDDVKSANEGDYPGFWFVTIVASGLMGEVSARW